MKRAREPGLPPPPQRIRLFQLPCDLLVYIGQFLCLRDLHAYLQLLFLRYGIMAYGEAAFHVTWNEQQLVLLDGGLALLHEKNTTQWPGWLQAKIDKMHQCLYDAMRTDRTLAQVRQCHADALKVSACRHFEVIKFVRGGLCERCEARHSLYTDPRLCSPCHSGMQSRTYMKEIPNNADPYSWVGRATLRGLCGLKRNTNVAAYANEHSIRSYGGGSSNTGKCVYLLKDALRHKRLK